MDKGRFRPAKHVGNKGGQAVKARSKAPAKKESIKKVAGKTPEATNAPPHTSASAAASGTAHAPVVLPDIMKDDLKQFAHLLKQLRSSPDGMLVLAHLLDSTNKKKLLDLLTTQSKDARPKLQEELKRSEALLRSLHTRERSLFDVAHGILMVLGADRTIRVMNKSGCRLLGYDEAELVGRNWIEGFVSKSRLTVIQTILDEVMNGTLNDEYEYPVATKGGEERIISWRSAVLRDGSGTVTGVVCSGEDLTMLRQLNAALERSEDRLHLMMDSVGEDEFFITDSDGYIVSWIARSKDGKNYRAEEMVGRHFSCLYSPEDFQAGKPMRILETAQNSGRYEEDGWRMRKDGSRSRAFVIVTAIRDNERHLLGFSNVTRYVVERAEAQAKRMFPLAIPVVDTL
ncbi:MAG: histidine kinase [Bacteroidetes bacterium]|nr:histidine kinase [Bacteroidota bacterium]